MVHESKLIHNLICYTYSEDNLPHENFLYINDQLTSPYFLKYAYTIKPQYMKGTLRNFDPFKNYYIIQPIKKSERPLIVPIETLEPNENYHSFHINGSVPVKPVKKYVEYLGSVSQQKAKTKSGRQFELQYHISILISLKTP